MIQNNQTYTDESHHHYHSQKSNFFYLSLLCFEGIQKKVHVFLKCHQNRLFFTKVLLSLERCEIGIPSGKAWKTRPENPNEKVCKRWMRKQKRLEVA